MISNSSTCQQRNVQIVGILFVCKTYLSFDGDAETIDGSLSTVSLPKNASGETDTGLCISHFDPLDIVTVECTYRNQPYVVLFTTNDHQQLFLGQIIDLVDAFTLANSSDFCAMMGSFNYWKFN